jgi:glutamine amidotransferase/cyclase
VRHTLRFSFLSFLQDPASVPHTCFRAPTPGPNGEAWCWWQCTVDGGRRGRDIDAIALARAVEALGAGEILLNCINNDGVGQVRP